MRTIAWMVTGLLVLGGTGCSETPQESNTAYKPASVASPIDVTRDGTYTEGEWQYVLAITDKGSRSQGTLGKLTYAQKPVPIPENAEDYYETSLGLFVYVGMPPGTDAHPIMPWDDKGWVPMVSDATGPTGQTLPLPGTKEALVWQTRKQMRGIVTEMASSDVDSGDLLLESNAQEKTGAGKDPWGTDFKVYPDRRGGEGGGEVFRWVIESAGPDKTFGTADDLERSSAFIQTGKSTSDDMGMDMLEGAMEPEPEAID